jgi:PEP-CTERM motif
MSVRKFTAAAVALASLALAQAAQAGTVNFEDRVFADHDTYQTEANSFTEQGLNFGGLQFYFIPSDNPAVTFPTNYSSTFMETAIEPVTMSLVGGGAFNLLSLDLGLGQYNQGSSDSVTISGTKANCSANCAVSTMLTVTDAFQSFSLAGFTGLSSISVGAQQFSNPGALFPPQADSGYLAFDDISYTAVGAPVPEPAAWALMIVGLGAAGGLIRGRRRALALAAAA